MLGLLASCVVCLAAPVALWWYGPDWASWLVWLFVLYLAGAWWMTRSHEHWSARVREVAARYVIACVYTVVAIWAVPVSLLVGLGRLVAWLAAVPVVVFGAHGLHMLAARRGWVAPADLFGSATYWLVFVALAISLGAALWYGLRLAARFDGHVTAAVGEAANGLSGLLAARFGVRLRD